VIDAQYPAVSTYCWKGLRALAIVSIGYLALAVTVAVVATRDLAPMPRGVARVWNAGATAVALCAVYIQASLSQACNE
jgi:hypothetical protein